MSYVLCIYSILFKYVVHLLLNELQHGKSADLYLIP